MYLKTLRIQYEEAVRARENSEKQMELISTQREFEALEKEIKDAAASGMKNVIPDALRHPGRRMVRPILIDQEAIFRFDSKNTIQHVSQLFIQGFCVVLVAKPMVVPPCVESRSVRTWGLNGRRQQSA